MFSIAIDSIQLEGMKMSHFETIYKCKYFHLQQIADGVHAAIVVKGSGALGNAGIVDLGERTLVFDTFFTPQAAAELRQAAEQLYSRPVSLVVNSHWHMDHIGGNQVFAEAEIIAAEKTREFISSDASRFIQYANAHPEYPEWLQQQVDQEKDEAKRMELLENLGDVKEFAASLPNLRLTLPNITFETSVKLHGSNRNAILLTYGGGHTESDSFLYLPDQQIAFMGDLLSVNNHPSIKHGNADEWITILERVKLLPLKTAVPGHGPVGGAGDLLALQTYLKELMQLLKQLKESGASLEQAMDTPIPKQYAGWEAASLFAQNIQLLYHQQS
jgi:cyclase